MEERIYRVLLIEDNHTDARLIREYLRTADVAQFALTHVDRLAAGLQQLETNPTDVVLLDLSLPDSYGWETFDRVHEQAPVVPIVILTGLQDEVLARKAASGGAQDFLVKDEITGSLLVRTLNYAIERQQLLQAQRKLNRDLAVLSDVNQAVVRATGEQALLDEVCAILAGVGGYCLVWVGFAEQNEQKRVRPMAWAGSKAAYLNTVDIVWADQDGGRGPTGRAIRAGRPFVVRDIQSDPIFTRWREEAVQQGFKAMVALPLVKDGVSFGVLDIYSTDGLAFDEAEVNLLIELAGDLTYGIDTLRTNIALRQSEEKFATAFHNSNVAIAITAVKSRQIIDVNESTVRLFGYQRSEMIGNTSEKLNIWTDSGARRQVSELLLKGQSVRDLELQGRSKNGEIRHMLASFDQIELEDEPCILTILHDITDRKQAEEARRQAQQLSQATIDALTAHIAVLDEQGTIIAVNQSWRDFAQTNNANLQRVGIGMNYLAVCDTVFGDEAEQAQRSAADIRAVLTGARDETWFEYPCHAPHEPRWFVTRVTPMPTDDPSRRRIVVAHENITSRRLAEEALRDSEHHYRLLFDSNPLPMWVYDLETLTFLAVNDAAVGQYGYAREEFLEMALDEIQVSEDPFHANERQHRLKDGRIVDVEIAFDGLNFEGRSAVLVTAFDITERKRAAAERIVEAQRLQQILDTMPEGVLLLDPVCRILNMNPTAEKLLPALTSAQKGDVLSEMGGRPLERLLQAAPQDYSWQEVASASGERLFELIGQPIKMGTVANGWVVILRDVTEERKRQQHLQMQQRLATVGQLAAGIAHDFNNIMAVISLYGDLLTKNPEHERRDYYLHTISEQAKHAARLISQILDFSRRSVMTRSKLDLRPFVKEAVKLLQRTLPETIEFHFDEPVGAYLVEADPTHLQQVLMNLALNARDAMPAGGALQIALTDFTLLAGEHAPVPDMAPGYWVCLSITDSGHGIPAQAIPHLFEPFFTTKKPGEGTGLGLAQVYGIVKQHNGEIAVSSEVGVGSTFTIYLPAVELVAKTAVPPQTSQLKKGGGQTILLVEDNEMPRNAIAEVLEILDYKVVQANNGAEALHLFAAHTHGIDLVLTDMVMPKMGGAELYAQLKALNQDVKVVVITGYPLEESGQKLLSQGIVAWIQKPFSTERLADIVHEVLG